jgi:3-phosphoshikimate 1-carboxyvinyltransferase
MELAKINCSFTKSDNAWILIPSDFDKSKTIEINTHNDHRIAMAFAPLALVSNGVIFDDDTVVKKSFPNFWNEIEKCGLMSSVI